MGTVKDVLYFCNTPLFYDYKNLGITDEFNQAPSFTINNFNETIPVERILILLSIVDDIIFKNSTNDVEDVVDYFRHSTSNIIYMIGFEKVVENDIDKVMN